VDWVLAVNLLWITNNQHINVINIHEDFVANVDGNIFP
jgi:hypothetical protein